MSSDRAADETPPCASDAQLESTSVRGRTRGAATRERLLDSATAILRERGVRGLTLDAVAQHAGVSKGGLIHHFPTHDALVEALLERWMVQFDEAVGASVSDEDPGAWLRAYLRQVKTTREPATDEESTSDGYALGLMLAFGHGSLTRSALRRVADRTQDHATSDGVDPVTAMIICMAVDGLWINEVLGMFAPRGELREKMLAELERMTHRT